MSNEDVLAIDWTMGEGGDEQTPSGRCANCEKYDALRYCDGCSEQVCPDCWHEHHADLTSDEAIAADVDAVLADPNLAVRLEEGARLRKVERGCNCREWGGDTKHSPYCVLRQIQARTDDRRLRPDEIPQKLDPRPTAEIISNLARQVTTDAALTHLRAIEQHLQLAYRHRHEAAKLEAALVELKGMVNRAITVQLDKQVLAATVT